LLDLIDGRATVEELARWIYLQDRGTAITLHDCTQWLEILAALRRDEQGTAAHEA
jgi:hypothetical protein